MYYKIGERIEEFEPKSFENLPFQYVAVVGSDEWASSNRKYNMGIEWDLNVDEITDTLAEVNIDSLTGTFSIPDRRNITGQYHNFAFALDEKGIVFEVIGPVPAEQIPAQENLTCIPWLSQEELAVHIAQADLCLAGHFSDTIGKAKRTIPGKAYIYRAMKKPMILGDTPANHELFTENEDIRFVPPGNPEALAQEIRNMLK